MKNVGLVNGGIEMIKIMMTSLLIIVLSLSFVFVTGCQSDAQTGAAIGTVAGAGIGQLAGGDTEATLIGAAVGGGAGYMLGNEADKKKAREEMASIRSQLDVVTVWFTNSNGSKSSVNLIKDGPGYVGPRGEYYDTLPTEDQLRPVYGF